MKYSKNKLLLNQASGKLGDFVIRQVRGKTVVSRRPAPSQRPLTAPQLAVRRRFTEASDYAKAALADPVREDLYKKGIKGKLYTARLVAISDFMNRPIIHHIDCVNYKGDKGDTITIKAEDDFMVKRVEVSLLSGGVVLETGEAVHDPHASLFWDYKATTSIGAEEVTVMVSAFDLAGNETQQQKEIRL